MADQYVQAYLNAIDNPKPELKACFNAEADLLIRCSGDNKYVFDIGCGAGRTILNIADHVGKIRGIDYNPAMINIAKKRCKKLGNVEIFQEDALKMKYKAEFDLSFTAYNMLGWDFDKRKRKEVIKNMASSVKEGGFIINITWKYDNFTTDFLKEYYPSIGIDVREVRGSKIFNSFGICDRISRDEFEDHYQSAGLRAINFVELGKLWLAAIGVR